MSNKDRNWYDITASQEHIRRERERAREIKKTRWWKQKIIEGICHYCGRKFQPDELTMDHVVPVARGGKSNRNNIVVSCFECNQHKGLDTAVDSILDNISGKKKQKKTGS